MLPWFDVRSSNATACLHQLGILSYRRGDYDQALDWYRKSLDIFEQLGNRAGMATSYHQLSSIFPRWLANAAC